MKNCYLDIETRPAGQHINPKELTPPANMSKQDTIDLWYQEKAPVIALEKYRNRALDSMEGEILCIGYAFEDEPQCVYGSTEETVLRVFGDELKRAGGEWKEQLTFVGWNITAFDIPWIWRKAIKYGLKDLRNAFNRDRYKGNHIDLMLTWATDFKDYNKMDNVAKFLGLPGKTGDITGATVYDAYLEGRIDDIRDYCKNDVLTIREIYHKLF